MNAAEQLRYIKLIQESSSVLLPEPVQLPSEWEALRPGKDAPILHSIQAVLFDIYGTLFISGAGEITAGTAAESSHKDTRENVEFTNSNHSFIPAAMKEYFKQAVIHYHEKAKTEGNLWPEVNVEAIWSGYDGTIPERWELPRKIRQLQNKIGPRAARGSTGRELSLRYELACNPVYPMPHAKEVLRSLAANGKKLGIISNAQFYTPLLFGAFFNASPAEMGFDPELLIYSFNEKEAKPSPRLFAKAKEILARQNIPSGETLYIGNDMRNDIIPAIAAGFKTALFAGDRRSLRLREGDPDCSGKKPDMVICNLEVFE